MAIRKPLYIGANGNLSEFNSATGDTLDGATAGGGGGGGTVWTVVTASGTAAANNGYITNNATTRVVETLPATAAVGAEINITNIGAAGWRVGQNANQYIRFGDVVTTTGTGGYVESTALGDTVRLICTVANSGWQVISSIGNITYL